MKKFRSLISVLAVAMGCLACQTPARAQMVDYQALQDLFGEPVTTSATGTPQRASEVAANMSIISADQIRRSGTRNIPQIIGMYVPGTYTLQEGINAFDVGVRGYQQPFQPRLLVLVDGRQVFTDDYSRMPWDNMALNIDDIRQIEVVRGASSALFGSNATGGVVNIITKNPLYDNDNVASFTYGTQSLRSGDATATMKLGEYGGIKISAGGLYEHEFSSARNLTDPNPIYNPAHQYISESSIFKANPKLSFNTEITYSHKSNQEGDYLYNVDPVKTDTYSFLAGFTWHSPYGQIRNSNYINHNARDITLSPSSFIQTQNQLIVSQLEDQFKIGNSNTFRVMLEYRNKKLAAQSSPLLVYERSDFTENVYAASGTWLWQISDKLSFTSALRLDRNESNMGGTLIDATFYPYAAYDQTFNTIAANAGLAYMPTDVDTFRVDYGRGIQVPSLINIGYNDPLFLTPGTTVIDVEGNPNLKPTVVENYELAYSRKFSEIFSTAKWAVFYQTNHDIITGDPSQPVRVIGGITYVLSTPINVGSSSGWGGELRIRGSHPSGFRWDGSYSYQSVHDSPLVSQTLNYKGSSPQHNIRLLLGYSTGPWEFDANAQILSSTNMLRSITPGSSPSTVGTDGYATLGGRVGYTINDHFMLSLSGINITHGTLQASPYPAVERQAFLTLTGKY